MTQPKAHTRNLRANTRSDMAEDGFYLGGARFDCDPLKTVEIAYAECLPRFERQTYSYKELPTFEKRQPVKKRRLLKARTVRELPKVHMSPPVYKKPDLLIRIVEKEAEKEKTSSQERERELDRRHKVSSVLDKYQPVKLTSRKAKGVLGQLETQKWCRRQTSRESLDSDQAGFKKLLKFAKQLF